MTVSLKDLLLTRLDSRKPAEVLATKKGDRPSTKTQNEEQKEKFRRDAGPSAL